MQAKEFIDEATKLLKERKDNYERIISSVEIYLEALLSEIHGITISGRVKDADNIAEKIYRKNYLIKYSKAEDFINDLPDGIGIRIVCLLNEDEENIYNQLAKLLKNRKNIKGKEYYYQDGKNFYVCLDNQPEKQKNDLDIYRMDCLWDDGDIVRIELQIKSLTNYFWGEIEHSLFYKNYDYTIGNDFYAGLMKNIHNELLNIDVEMSALEKHMKKTTQNQIQEIRQISAAMISQKFSDRIQSIMGCKIDLRESYALLVDMYFGVSTDVKDNINKFNKLIDKLDRANDTSLKSEYDSLNKMNFAEREVAKSTLGISRLINDNVQSGDIFWQFLYLMYKSIFAEEENNYSEILSGMASRIRKLYIDIQEVTDVLNQEEELDIIGLIDDVFLEIAKDRNKISFFVLNIELEKTKDILSSQLCYIQDSIVSNMTKLDIELFNENIQLIKSILYLSTVYLCGRKVRDEELIEFLENAENKNDYSLKLNEEVIDLIKIHNNLKEEEIERMVNQFGKEEA